MEDNSTKKSFWQTMPGILTALAAIITALTGLLLAFNQMGYFKKTSAETLTNITSSQTKNDAEANEANLLPASDAKQTETKNIKAKFSMTDIKGEGGEN